jgi:hypothetical protein
MPLVGGVPMPFVHVVDVIVVGDRLVAAVGPVHVVVRFGAHVVLEAALVVVPVVLLVDVTVVQVVHVALVLHRGMSAIRPVYV